MKNGGDRTLRPPMALAPGLGIGDLRRRRSGTQCAFDAGDRRVGAHKRNHAPKPWRTRGRRSRSRFEIAIAQRRKRRRNRAHTARGRVGGNQRWSMSTSGVCEANLRKSAYVAGPPLRVDLTVMPFAAQSTPPPSGHDHRTTI